MTLSYCGVGKRLGQERADAVVSLTTSELVCVDLGRHRGGLVAEALHGAVRCERFVRFVPHLITPGEVDQMNDPAQATGASIEEFGLYAVSPSISGSGRLCGARNLSVLTAKVAARSSAWTDLVLRTGAVVYQEGQTA
jgi:hypothetical protein